METEVIFTKPEIKKTLIFFKIVSSTFNSLKPVSFLLGEISPKYNEKLPSRINFNVQMKRNTIAQLSAIYFWEEILLLFLHIADCYIHLGCSTHLPQGRSTEHSCRVGRFFFCLNAWSLGAITPSL